MDSEKFSQGSQPLLDEPLDCGDEIGYAEESVWRRDANGTRRDDCRRLKIIILALSVAYIPFVVISLMLFIQHQSAQLLENVRPSGLFPCTY